jgi:Family of unknown function (DUF5906)
MATLIECPELIEVVLGAIAKRKGGSSGASHSFRQQQDCELSDGVGPLKFEQLSPKVCDAVSLLLNSPNSDIIPHFQRFQKLWSGSWHGDYQSQSEADAAFCGLLVREGLSSVEIDMALRASALYRKKWEREDYRRGTISGVMSQTHASSANPTPQASTAQGDWVSEMNERYALVRMGADIQVMDFLTPNPCGQMRAHSAKPMKLSTFKTLLAGQFVEAGEGKLLPKANRWLNHQKRRQHDGVAYAPGGTLSPNLLNLWQGFTIEPMVGDISPWTKLLNDLISNPALAAWVMNWLAWRVQNLDKVPGTVLIFRGEKGTGKNSLFEPIIAFFGSHAMVADDPELIIGRFNWHLMTQSFVVLDEAVFAGDHRQADKLKSRITATQMVFEAKGMTPVAGANRCAYVMLTNHDHVWQATLDERRAIVVNVADKLRGDFDFWVPYYEWCKTTGPASLLHHLLSLDVATFNPRQIPNGTAIEDQIALTALRDPVIAWWHQCLLEGCIRWLDGNIAREVELEPDTTTSVERAGLRLSYEQSAGARGKPPVAWGVVAKRLRGWCQPHGIKESRRLGPNGHRFREDVLPSLTEMQQAFTEQAGLKF